MPNDPIETVIQRLQSLEARVALLEQNQAPSPAVDPGPAYAPVYAPRPTVGASAKASPDGSEWLQRKLLPAATGLAFLAGIGYLVGAGVQRGWITPAVVSVLAALACLGLMALGQRLRADQGIRGEALLAAGFAALFVNAGVSHSVAGLISGEALLGWFSVLAAAGLVGSISLRSPLALAVAATGGFAAAAMPINSSRPELVPVLTLMTALSVGATAQWLRLPKVALYAAVPATLLLLGVSKGAAAFGAAGLAALGLLCVEQGLREPEDQPFAAWRGLWSAGITLFLFDALAPTTASVGAALAASVGCAVVAFGSFTFRRNRNHVGTGVACVGLMVIPSWLPSPMPPIAAGVAALAAAVAVLRLRTSASFASAVFALLVAGAYGAFAIVDARSSGAWEWTFLLPPLLAFASSAALVGSARRGTSELAPALVMMAGACAWTGLALFGPAASLGETVGLSLGLAAAALAALVLAQRRGDRQAKAVGLGLVLATGAKVVLLDLASLDVIVRAALMLGLSGIFWLASSGGRRSETSSL